MNDPKPTQPPKLPPYSDRPDCVEVYADTVQPAVFAGTVRIEFCAFRFAGEGTGTSRRVPVARVTLPKGLAEKMCEQVMGLLKKPPDESGAAPVSSGPVTIQ